VLLSTDLILVIEQGVIQKLGIHYKG
jgi:hypothetical protein